MFHKPSLGLIISIISVSFAAIFIVTLQQQYHTHPLTISFYRLLFTTLLLIPFLTLHKKTRNEIHTLTKKQFAIMASIGVILAAHFALWITSLNHTSVASSVILVTAHPILVAPLAYILLKEKLSTKNITGIILSITGVTLLVYGNYGWTTTSLDTLYGNILAMLGGAAAGLYILGGRIMRKNISIITYAIIVYTIGTITLGLICLLTQAPLLNLSSQELLIILLMAVIAGILGHTLYNWSLKYIRASVASVSLLGEPIGSSILAFLIPWIQQTPSPYTLIGGTIILIGIYLSSRKIYTKKPLKKI